MKICVLSKNAAAIPECDVALFGFGFLGDVDYEAELKGKTDKFGVAATLSRKYACTTVCACKTISYGAQRLSAAVASGGKLLGICDMAHVLDGEDYKSGANLGIYAAGGFKIGVLIENDLLFAEGVQALSCCGCNVILAACCGAADFVPPMLARAYAYLYGVPIALCTGRAAYFAETGGQLACSLNPAALFETDGKNSYRLVHTRLRGIKEDASCDY